jgi:hypothetical protein
MGVNPKRRDKKREIGGRSQVGDQSQPHPPGKTSYYYDDAHGYEDFDPDFDEKDEDELDEIGEIAG